VTKHHHLADDLLRAREEFPHDAHLRDAVVAFLSRAVPACRDETHVLCHKVASAAAAHRASFEDNE
jgi:hypothetical protein